VTLIDKIAWIHLDGGSVLSTRNRGIDVYYLPGGKREPGESDVETLVREVREELGVGIAAGTAAHLGTFEAQAHGHPSGTIVRMACYTASYEGTLVASAEVEEFGWLTWADRDRVSPVDRLVLDHLRTLRLLA
jgi:8-oxo-dGTP diphosphatase